MKRIKSNGTIWVTPYKRKKKTTLKNRSDSEHSSWQRVCLCVTERMNKSVEAETAAAYREGSAELLEVTWICPKEQELGFLVPLVSDN